MSFKKTLLALALAATLPFGAQAAKIKVYPVVVDVDRSRATIHVTNLGSEPLNLEAVGKAVRSDSEVGVFPPIASLPPGQKQVFRLILPTATDSTQHWRVRITEVSPKEFGAAKNGGQVRNELAFEVPVFLSPAGSTPQLVREGGQIRNAGKRQVLITRIGDKKQHLYLLPGDRVEAAPGVAVFSGDRELSVN